MRVAVLGDTHVPTRGHTLPASAWAHVVESDLILHTGDVCLPSLLDELAGWGPVHVAMGNCDPPEIRAWGARDEVHLNLEGVRVVMLHDSGRADGRARRMRRGHPEADVVIFGHSHQPLCEREEGLLLLNPGSPLDRRRAPHHTMAVLTVADGRASAELVQLD